MPFWGGSNLEDASFRSMAIPRYGLLGDGVNLPGAQNRRFRDAPVWYGRSFCGKTRRKTETHKISRLESLKSGCILRASQANFWVLAQNPLQLSF